MGDHDGLESVITIGWNAHSVTVSVGAFCLLSAVWCDGRTEITHGRLYRAGAGRLGGDGSGDRSAFIVLSQLFGTKPQILGTE